MYHHCAYVHATPQVSFGEPTSIKFSVPYGDVVYVSNTDPSYISAMDLTAPDMHTSVLVGQDGSSGAAPGVGTNARFDSARSMAITGDGRLMYIADDGEDLIVKVDLRTREMTVVAEVDNEAWDLAVSPDGSVLYYSDGDSLT